MHFLVFTVSRFSRLTSCNAGFDLSVVKQFQKPGEQWRLCLRLSIVFLLPPSSLTFSISPSVLPSSFLPFMVSPLLIPLQRSPHPTTTTTFPLSVQPYLDSSICTQPRQWCTHALTVHRCVLVLTGPEFDVIVSSSSMSSFCLSLSTESQPVHEAMTHFHRWSRDATFASQPLINKFNWK